MPDSVSRPAIDAEHDEAVRRGGERFKFLREFVCHPEQIGSIVPSSHHLERRLVEIGDLANAPTVVELGPGTGGTTRAFLRALRGDARLLAIDINPRFTSLLASVADPRLTVHLGSAVDLRTILARHGLSQVDAVLSGIPFSTMPASTARRILEAVMLSLAPGGRFVAYQILGTVGAIGRAVIGSPEVTLVLRNIPPVRIYTWRKQAAP